METTIIKQIETALISNATYLVEMLEKSLSFTEIESDHADRYGIWVAFSEEERRAYVYSKGCDWNTLYIFDEVQTEEEAIELVKINFTI